MRPSKLRRVNWLLVSLLWPGTQTASAQNYTFINIIDSQSGYLSFADEVSLNNSGAVLFHAGRSTTGMGPIGDIIGVYKGTGEQVTTVREVRFGEAVALGTLNDQGVALVLETTTAHSTLTTYNGGDPTVIADTATSQFAEFGWFRINNNGTVVFSARLDSGETGLFSISGGQVKTLVAAADFPTIFTSSSGLGLNDAGTTVFKLEDPPLPTGSIRILVVPQNGAPTAIAESILQPGANEQTSFSDPAINNNNTVVFIAASFVRDTLTTTTTVTAGSSAATLLPLFSIRSGPGNIPFGTPNPKEPIDINNNEGIAFYGTPAGAPFGIFTGPDAAADKVIQEGDPLFGSTLAELSEPTAAGFLNDSGQIAFHYKLTNGVTGIALATPTGSPQPRPQLPANSVVDAASFLPVGQPGASPSAGSVVSIFGNDFATGLTVAETTPLPTKLANVQVTFNGIAAPLFFVSPKQINAQLPVEFENTDVVEVRVATPGGQSDGQMLDVAALSPSIFSVNQSGSGQGIVVFVNTPVLAAPAGLTADSRPARAGDILTVYANGLGAVNPPIATGINSCVPDGVCKPDFSNLVLRHAVVRPVIEVGGMAIPDANIHFAGLAPQFVGLYQINFTMPEGIPPGDAVPIVIRQGAASSRSDITIAVE